MNEIKKYHTLKLVHEGKKKKERASVELGLTRRQVNRLLRAYEVKGKEAFETVSDKTMNHQTYRLTMR